MIMGIVVTIKMFYAMMSRNEDKRGAPKCKDLIETVPKEKLLCMHFAFSASLSIHQLVQHIVSN